MTATCMKFIVPLTSGSKAVNGAQHILTKVLTMQIAHGKKNVICLRKYNNKGVEIMDAISFLSNIILKYQCIL